MLKKPQAKIIMHKINLEKIKEMMLAEFKHFFFLLQLKV